MNHVLSDWKVDFFFPKIIKVLFKLLPPLKHGNDSNSSSKTNGSVSNNKADNNNNSSSSKKDQLDNHIRSKDNDNYHIEIHDYYSDKEIKQLHQYILTLCRYITSLHPNYTLYYFTNIYDDDDVDYYYRNASLSSSTTTAAAAAIDTAITPTKSKSNIGYHLFSTNHHSKSSSPTSTNNNSSSSNTIRNLTYYSYIIKCLQSNLFLNDPSTESAAFLLLDTLCCYSDKMRQAIQSEISIEFLKNKINILIPSVTEKVSKLFVTLYGINLEYSSSSRSSSSSFFINKMKSTTTTTNSNNIVVDGNSIINHHHHAKSVEEISCLQYIFEVILQITQNKLQKLNQTKHNIHALSSPSSSLASKYQPNINNHINKNNNDYDKDDNYDTDNNSTSISSCFDCMFNIIYMIGMKIQIYKIDSLHDIITKIITLISYQFHDLSQFQLSDTHIIDIFFILVGKIEKSWLLINNIITPTSTNTDCGSNRSSNKNIGSSNGRSSASNHADIIEYEFSKQSIILIEHFSRIAMTYDILNDPTKNANTNNNNNNNNTTIIPTNNVIYSGSGNNYNDDENINYKFTKSTLSDDEFDDDDDDDNNNMNNYDDDDDDDDDDDYPHSYHLSNNNKKTYLNSKNIDFFRLFLSNPKFDLFINEFLQQWELDPIELTCKLIHIDKCLL